MSKQSQKEAVYSAVMNVLSENGITVESSTDVGTIMNRTLRAQVNQVLVEGFRSGSIELEKAFNDTELKAYVSGLHYSSVKFR